MQPNSSNSSPIPMILAGIIFVVVLAGVFFLTWHKSITGGEALGIVSTIVGIAGAIISGHITSGAITKAQTNAVATLQTPPPVVAPVVTPTEPTV